MIRKSFKTLLYLAIFLILSQSAYALNIVKLSPGYYPNTSRSRALSTADIYVGKPDLDPEIVANQKTLSVQQEDGTITAVSQPIHTNAGGVPVYSGSPVTLLVEGDYSLKVLDSSGSQIYYVPSTAYEQYLVAGNYYYPDYSEADQGVAGGGSTVTDILTEVGATENATIYFSHNSGENTTTYTFTTNTSVTDNFNIIIEDGVILDGAGILTINGPFDAGLYQVFGSSVTITFGTGIVKALYPQWWGVQGDGATDDTTNFQRCLTASGGMTVKVPSPTSYYKIASATGLNSASNSRIIGDGWPRIHNSTANSPVIDIADGTNDVEVAYLRLTVAGSYDAGAAGRSAIDMAQSGTVSGLNRIWIHDNRIDTCSICGISGNSVNDLTIEDNVIDVSNGEHGIYIDGSLATAFKDLFISNNKVSGNTTHGHGIKVSGNNQRIIITGNQVNTWASYAIMVTSQGGYDPIGVAISDNICHGTNAGVQSGIYVLEVTDLTVSDNQIYYCSYDAYNIQGCTNITVTGNIARGVSTAAQYGMRLHDSVRGEIANNLLVDTVRGMYFDDGSTHLDVHHNYINHTSNSGTRGIQLENATATVIWVHDNIILGHSDCLYQIAEYTETWNNRQSTSQTMLYENAAPCLFSTLTIAAGTTAGKMKSTTNGYFTAIGKTKSHSAADDKWDLTGVSTGAGEYKKVALCLNYSDGASIVEGVIAASQAAAIIPFVNPELVVIGIVEIGQNYGGGALGGNTFYDTPGFVRPY